MPRKTHNQQSEKKPLRLPMVEVRMPPGAAPKRAVKRFVVFSGDQFYPDGGWRDFRSSHATLAAARRAAAPGDWRQIVDLATGRLVDTGRVTAADRARLDLKIAALRYANALPKRTV